nr:hypothetical protein [Pectobacterium parmentieri]
MKRGRRIIMSDKSYSELKFLNETAVKVIGEFADELGCKPDNEVILQSIEDLKNKVAELERQRDAWKWCCEYQYNKDWPALDYDIFDHQHEAEEKARDTEGNVFPIYKSTQETQVDFLPKNLDRALTIMGIAIQESKEEFNFQSERWIQRLINAVLRMGKQSQPYTVPDEMTYADAVNFIQINGMCNETREGIAMRVHNHCRAAMLQSGNSPVSPESSATPIRYMNRFTGNCVTLEQQPDADTDTDVYIPLVPQHRGE